jgi:hypothetical protein
MLTIDIDYFPQQNWLAVFVTEAVNVYCAVETKSSVHYLEELSYRRDPGSNPGLVRVELGHVYLRTRRSSPLGATHQSSLLFFVLIFLLAAKAGFCACTIILLHVGCGKP